MRCCSEDGDVSVSVRDCMETLECNACSTHPTSLRWQFSSIPSLISVVRGVYRAQVKSLWWTTSQKCIFVQICLSLSHPINHFYKPLVLQRVARILDLFLSHITSLPVQTKACIRNPHQHRENMQTQGTVPEFTRSKRQTIFLKRTQGKPRKQCSFTSSVHKNLTLAQTWVRTNSTSLLYLYTI